MLDATVFIFNKPSVLTYFEAFMKLTHSCFCSLKLSHYCSAYEQQSMFSLSPFSEQRKNARGKNSCVKRRARKEDYSRVSPKGLTQPFFILLAQWVKGCIELLVVCQTIHNLFSQTPRNQKFCDQCRPYISYSITFIQEDDFLGFSSFLYSLTN